MNENGKQLRHFATFNELNLRKHFYERKKFINIIGVEEGQGH